MNDATPPSPDPPDKPAAPHRPAPPPEDGAGEELQAILRQAAEGDEAAWTQIVERFSRRVYGLLLKRCGDRELAEELTQITFVKVVTKLGADAGYEEQGKFKAWLFRVAMNNLRDEMRRRGRQAMPMDMSGGASGRGDEASAWAAAEAGHVERGPWTPAGPLEQVDQAEQVVLLREAIKTLPDQDQELLYLRHTAGLTFPEIAATLKQPLGTVLARGHRAIGKLRKILTQEDDE